MLLRAVVMKDNMEKILEKEIERILIDLGAKDLKVVVSVSAYFNKGDYSTNVAMAHSKELGKNPMDLAEEIKKELESVDKMISKELSNISKIEVVKPGYINFFFTPEYFAKNLTWTSAVQVGENGVFEGKKFIVEHTQPNPFKEFHIGHLMNNTIGESVARIVRKNGAEVQTATYHGDVGLHIAKAVWAIKNGVDFKDAYATGHKAYENDDDLNNFAKKEIIEINKKIYEESDTEVSKIYEEGRAKSLEFFEEMYKRLDSEFNFHFYESQAGEIGGELVRENIGTVFEKGDPVRNNESGGESVSSGTGNAPIIFKGENFEPKTHTRVFLNSEGLPTYEAKELGLAQIKRDWFKYDSSITITANEQDSFFKVVEVAIGEVFPELKGKLHHLSHGLLKLPTGKMSSRYGNIISAESLIDQVKQKVLAKSSKDSIARSSEAGFREKVDDITIEIIAIGAIKYTILRQAIGGDIIFDFDKSISFEGDSGPYLQYSVVRANSVLQKADMSKRLFDMKVPEGWETTNIERLLERFGSVVKKAGREYAPHHIVTYLTDLASEFNSFYASHKIIDEGDNTSPYRVVITKAFAEIMTEGLRLLGIKIPERM